MLLTANHSQIAFTVRATVRSPSCQLFGESTSGSFPFTKPLRNCPRAGEVERKCFFSSFGYLPFQEEMEDTRRLENVEQAVVNIVDRMNALEARDASAQGNGDGKVSTGL